MSTWRGTVVGVDVRLHTTQVFKDSTTAELHPLLLQVGAVNATFRVFEARPCGHGLATEAEVTGLSIFDLQHFADVKCSPLGG